MRFTIKKTINTAIFLIVLILLRIYLFEIYAVNQVSMKNTYKDGDRVLILKNLYSIKRNDVLIFKHNDEDVIKRCVGLFGDTIKITDGILYSNNKIVKTPEKAIIEYDATEDVIAMSNIQLAYKANWSLKNFGPYVVPKKGMKLLLTTYNLSIYGGLINKDSLSNTNNLRNKIENNFYIFQNDYLFLVGDNRMQSTDSRIFGPVPLIDIKGKVVLKF